MFADLVYAVSYGNDDVSGELEWEIELTEEEAEVYSSIIRMRDSFAGVDELESVLWRAESEVENFEINYAIEDGNEYVCDCLGLSEVTVDELNDLVHNKDNNALEYFNLINCNPEEIAKWDANNLSKLPIRKEFDPKFEPQSPFSKNWEITELRFADVDEIPEYAIVYEDEVRETLKYLLQNANGDYSIIDDYLFNIEYNCYCQCDGNKILKEVLNEMGLNSLLMN